MSNVSTSAGVASRLSRPLAQSVWLAAAVLVAFGGAITTLRAGMAIDGWWVLDRGAGDHFLLAYPIEKWFKNSGTFAEHTHRLVGVLVGLLSIGYVCARAVERPRSGVKLTLAWAGLLAVCVQGAVGGLRVLENSEHLAFLHGALAQLVFALLGVNVVVSSSRWSDRDGARSNQLRGSAVGWIAASCVYAQIVLGAWLRHTGVELALVLHVVFAVGAGGAVLALIRELRRRDDPSNVFKVLAKRLLVLLVSQLGVGLATLIAIFVVSGGFKAEVSGAETISATLHVLLGALLLQQTVAAALMSARVSGAPRASSSTSLTDCTVQWDAAR